MTDHDYSPVDNNVTHATNASPSQPTAHKPKKSHKCLIATLIILLLIIAAFAAGFWCWHQYEVRKQAGLTKQLNVLKTMWINTQAQVENQGHTLEMTQQALQQAKKNWQEERQENWPLAHAQYLIKMAVFNLTFENNTTLAAQILKAADDQLQTLNNPAILTVRQAIADDITALKAVPTVDTAGLLTTINAVSAQIEKLPQFPLVTPGIPGAPAMTIVNANAAPPKTSLIHKTSYWADTTAWLKKFAHEVWQVLQTMIVIHHNAPNAEPLLPPEQYTYIRINVQAQLALAQWAVLRQQPQIYQESLKQAIAWISRYYRTGYGAEAGNATNAVLTQLQDLTKIDIKPPAPDLSRSLQAIERAMSQTSQTP